MKNLLSTFFTAFTFSICFAQPNMTLWITPDGYHTDHQHNASIEYFCDSSYYIFYHTDPDTLFITVKNDGTETLDISAINTSEFNGSNFEVIGFSSQNLLPGEMYTLKLLYQLPSQYFNGINGQISFINNDPNKSVCTLYFDVGCIAYWETRTGSTMGVPGGCDNPVIYVKDLDLLSPNMLFNDFMSFYAFDGIDTSHQIMQLSDYGVGMRKDVLVHDRFYAGLTGNGSENAFNVDTSVVNVNRYLNVNAKLHVVDILDADNGIACAGALDVTGNSNLDGALDVSGNAVVHGTMEVEAMTSPSDSRLKKDINPIQESLPKMMKLSPKTYFLKTDENSNHPQYGFLAQELETVIPDVVHSNSDGLKSVNYMQIIPWLTAALQEQQQLIIHQQKEIDELKRKLKSVPFPVAKT